MDVLVVYAHPVEGSYASALRDAAVAALGRAGHRVDLLDLYAEGFDPVMSLAERRGHHDGVEGRPAIAGHARRLQAADTLVFVHPTWWGGPPAMVKGWLDRVWTEGVAYTLPAGSSRIRGRLRRIKRVVVVTTHGSSKWINALQGESGKRLYGRGLRTLVHPLARVRWVALYGMDSITEAERARFVQEVGRRLGGRRL